MAELIIPIGKEVYFWYCGFIFRSVFRSVVDYQFLDNLIFVELSKDGLYATPKVREVWKRNIHLHPHCTLFEMLQDQLKS